ncbi:MAG: heparinase II/III domain-containing protein [Thermoproteota archaeon]
MNSQWKAPPSEEILKKMVKIHPRLLLTRSKLHRIEYLIRTNEKAESWFDRLHSSAQSFLSKKPLQYEIPDGLRLLHVSRGVQERVYKLALAYLLTLERRFADRAWQELDSAANFQDWNPRHFLDTAEMTHAFAIGYDWLYDVWNEEQRMKLHWALVDKGLKPALECYRGRSDHGWWVSSRHNWNQVCNGGIGVGALAIADKDPEIAGEIVQSALRSIRVAMSEFAPDGGWAEGPGYWAYATFYNVIFIEALSTSLGTDFGLSKFKGFSETGFFIPYLTGPTGLLFNFADCDDRLGNIPQALWLASRFNRPIFAQQEMRKPIPHPLDLVWFTNGSRSYREMSLPLDKYFRNVEVATMRSDWDDEGALFVAFKAGDNKANHSHLDCGTFVLDALGYRWAIDLGPDDYNLPSYFEKDRWKYYRLRSEGHNTLVIDPGQEADQNPIAKTQIVRFESLSERAFAIANLTPAYEKSARSVLRGISILERRRVLVQDEVETKNPSHLWWFMHTCAQIELKQEKDEAILMQGEAKMLARILSPSDARFEIIDAKPLPTSPKPKGQEENEDVRKLAIHLRKISSVQIAVLLTPFEGVEEPPSESIPINRLSKW